MAVYFNLYTLAKTIKRRERQKKNRHHQLLFQLMRMRRADAARIRENESRMRPRNISPGGKKEWTDKVSTVRNRLTGRKRDAKERWNRFAGTSDAGGRGL